MCAIFKAQFIQVFLTVLSWQTVVPRVFAWLLASEGSFATANVLYVNEDRSMEASYIPDKSRIILSLQM